MPILPLPQLLFEVLAGWRLLFGSVVLAVCNFRARVAHQMVYLHSSTVRRRRGWQLHVYYVRPVVGGVCHTK